MELKIDEPWITSKIRCQNGYVYIDKAFWRVFVKTKIVRSCQLAIGTASHE